MRSDRPQKIEDLKLGDHVCHIFEREEDRDAIATPFILIGLERGEKILCVTDANSKQAQKDLIEKRPDVSVYIESGQFSVISGDKFARGTDLEADEISSFIREETEAALAEGYFALRIINEMDWACRLPNFEQLVEQLAMVNKLIFDSKCLVLCQFDRRHFLPIMLQSVLHVYPAVIIDREIYENKCSFASGSLPRSDLPELKLNNLIGLLKERKKLEQALQEEKRRSRIIMEKRLGIQAQMLDSVEQAAIASDADGKITYWNHAAELFYGWSCKEALGRSILKIIPDRDYTTQAEKIMSRLRCGKSWSGEFTFKHKDGKVFRVKVTDVPILDERGRLDGIISISTDTTKRRLMVEQLSVEDVLCQAIIEQAVEGLCVCHEIPEYPFLRFTVWNDKMKEITGYTREEINCLGWRQSLYPDPEQQKQSADRMARVRSGQKLVGEEWEIARKDGRKRVLSVYTTFLNLGESPIYVLGMVHDITEKKRAEEALKGYSEHLEALVEERTEQLKNAERLAAIGETAAMIGHDLRNPLQALFCMVYLAKERLNSGNISSLEGQLSLEDILDSMEESADYMNKIVSDIQDYARTLSLNLVKTDISYFIRDTLSTINIPDNVRITIQVEEKPLEFNIDLEKMKRIIINLVTNSLNAMPEGGRISIYISARQGGDFARISVKDTGVGIPEEILPKLFLPLFTTRSKGVGLGLSVCKRMVDAMGGNIVINSRVGEGTEAIIEIPMRQDNG